MCRVFIADVEEGTPTKTSVVTEHLQAIINDTVDALERTLVSPPSALYAATHDYVTRVATCADEWAPRPRDRPLATEFSAVTANRAEPLYTFSQTFITNLRNVFGNNLTKRNLPSSCAAPMRLCL